ncbi:hypothetical protein [Brevundimonas sp. CEF1]|uniref:hypothetical protein n=1 Tax=Brevundimonas sp. CEF1 TaxID=3442642 RepID=UPI003F50F312
MTSVPHSGAKSVTPGGSVAGGHTKGPWVVTSDGHYVSPAADLTKIVALVFRPDTDSETERHDNAYLMAAAPDLLEALREARDALHQHYVDWDGEPEDAVPLQLARAKCEAAIAKATAGETRNAEPIHRRDGDEG